MLDCFRTGEANNPEVFVTAIAATLARYPDQVIYDVTDPRTGIPSKISWMPTIKDVREACDRAYAPIQQQVERERRIAEQLAAREAEENKPRPTLEQLQAKYGKDWGLMTKEPRSDLPAYKAPTKEELAAHYREYGLAFQPKQQTAAE
jgi:hypothetical protein